MAVAIPELMAEARAAQADGDPDRAGRLYRQVVRSRPEHAGAWLARIELALTQHQHRRALRQCAAALSLCPGHRTAIETKRARALEARGRREEALALLEAVCAEAPDDLPAHAVQAAMRQRAGDLSGADDAWGEVLRLNPDHPGAWLARCEHALQQGAPARALERIDAALDRLPAQALPLRIKRLRALDALGRVAEALALAGPLVKQAPDNAQLALIAAGLKRRSGDLEGAEESYVALLARWPDQLGAWQARCDMARAAGDPDRALALAEEGLRHLPGNPALTARQAGLMLLTGQTGAARAVLKPALERAPEDLHLRLALARTELQAGQLASAEAQFAACVASAPENEAALLGLADVTEAQGDPAAGLAALRPRADSSPVLGLKAAELALLAGAREELRALLDRLSGAVAQMTEDGLLRLFKLGEQADHSDAVLAVVEAIAARDTIAPPLAQFLVARARVIAPPDTAAGIRDALEARLPPADRPGFRAYAAGFFDSPDRALAEARAGLRGLSGPQVAEQLSERLLHAGKGRLALRYLGFCVRRWPNARPLRAQLLRVATRTGLLAPARDWLDSLAAHRPDLDLGYDRMQLMIAEGRLEEVREMAGARAREGLRTLSPPQFLDLALALGDLEAANTLARQVQTAPGAGRQNAAHFSVTLPGAKLNELRLYTAARNHAVSAGEAPEVVDARLAEDFFYPAKRIVDARTQGFGPRRARVTVPRRIFQYWHSPQRPEEVEVLMQSWRGAPGFEHEVYDRGQALNFLRDAFGPRHVRAFRLTHSPAEECDFLRLCLLYKYGGIYADADDMLIGDANRLIAEGPGLILMREPWGAIANNLICAPAGHPLLLWALRKAGRSLLARENDGSWFKTGPGLMTRALATWLGEATRAEAEKGLTVLTPEQLAPHVQAHVRLSYKTSGQYWNARDRHAPAPVVAALAGLAG